MCPNVTARHLGGMTQAAPLLFPRLQEYSATPSLTHSSVTALPTPRDPQRPSPPLPARTSTHWERLTKQHTRLALLEFIRHLVLLLLHLKLVSAEEPDLTHAEVGTAKV